MRCVLYRASTASERSLHISPVRMNRKEVKAPNTVVYKNCIPATEQQKEQFDPNNRRSIPRYSMLMDVSAVLCKLLHKLSCR